MSLFPGAILAPSRHTANSSLPFLTNLGRVPGLTDTFTMDTRKSAFKKKPAREVVNMGSKSIFGLHLALPSVFAPANPVKGTQGAGAAGSLPPTLRQ